MPEGESLNKLIIHDDVPFFWDNWDIMHHAFETKVKELKRNDLEGEKPSRN